jgi:hypothetical protein
MASFTDTVLCNRQLGYGTWQAAPGEVGNGVYEALKIGYRHLVSVTLLNWHCCVPKSTPQPHHLDTLTTTN